MMRRNSQTDMMETMHRGSETASHSAQLGAGFMLPIAIMFCGDEIGVDMPPMFEASAMPSTSILA